MFQKIKLFITLSVVTMATACSILPTNKGNAKDLLDRAIVSQNQQHYAAALTQFQAADAAGHAQAPRYIGLIYLNGLGVKKNPRLAFQQFQRAANQGDETAQYWLAYCYENGVGTAADLTLAKQWYAKAVSGDESIAKLAIDALKRLKAI